MEHRHDHKSGSTYGRLIAELALDFVAVYLVMYAMIATLAHLHLNLNNLYTTRMMVAPMTIVMLVSIRSMFPSRLNLIIGIGAVIVFLGSFAAMRSLAGIGNADFLRSISPHHSGAILMCEQASIIDPEIVALSKQIINSQQREITQMQAILARH